MADDKELARRAASGDADAFGSLFRQYAGDVYRLARSMGHLGEDAEDVMQDTFLAAFEGLGRYAERASFKTWLFAILFRQSKRRHRYLRRREMGVYDESSADHATGPVPASRPVNAEHRIDAMAMLDSLSAAHREVLVLRELQGLSYEEIAETLNVPRGTVESRLFRARNLLRERYNEYGTEPRRLRRVSQESRHG